MNKKERKILVFSIRIINCLTLVEPIFKSVIFFFLLSQVWTHKKKMPEFSFGIRHSQYLAPLIVDQADWTWTYILIHKFLGSYFSFFFLKRCYTDFYIKIWTHFQIKKRTFCQVSSTFLALVYNILYDKKSDWFFTFRPFTFFYIYTFIKWWKFFCFFVCMYLPRLW